MKSFILAAVGLATSVNAQSLSIEVVNANQNTSIPVECCVPEIITDFNGEGIPQFAQMPMINCEFDHSQVGSVYASLGIYDGFHELSGQHYSVTIHQMIVDNFPFIILDTEVFGTGEVIYEGSPATFTNSFFNQGLNIYGDYVEFETVEYSITDTGFIVYLRQAADINRNDVVNINDIFDYLALWFNSSFRADTNCDGNINTTDIFDYLTEWFS